MESMDVKSKVPNSTKTEDTVASLAS